MHILQSYYSRTAPSHIFKVDILNNSPGKTLGVHIHIFRFGIRIVPFHSRLKCPDSNTKTLFKMQEFETRNYEKAEQFCSRIMTEKSELLKVAVEFEWDEWERKFGYYAVRMMMKDEWLNKMWTTLKNLMRILNKEKSNAQRGRPVQNRMKRRGNRYKLWMCMNKSHFFFFVVENLAILSKQLHERTHFNVLSAEK